MKPTLSQIRQLASRYPRVIEWSPEDNAFLGSAPPLVGHCCHGASEAQVASQLKTIVEDLCADVLSGVIPKPKRPKKKFSGKFVVRLSPQLHKKLHLLSEARKESLNQFVAEKLEAV